MGLILTDELSLGKQEIPIFSKTVKRSEFFR